MDIAKVLGPNAATDWEPSVVDQFTRDGVLWAVPQLTDAGIAVYFNADLIEAAGVDLRQLLAMRWSPGDVDTLRPLLARLTVDADGRRADEPGFDARRVRQWGYNAANDLQGIYLNYIGSAGGMFSDGDRFAFDNPGSVAAFDYLVRLINDDHVAPPASDTNGNGDFSRNQFLQGRMALFQSGTYNLASIADQSRFRWGVVPMPIGPVGRVSVTNGIAAAGNSATKHPDAVRQVLAWMGSARGNQYLGARGAAIPAVLAGAARLLRLLGATRRRRRAVLHGARRPADTRARRRRDSPRDTRRCSRTSTRCSSGAADVATTPGRCPGRRERRGRALTRAQQREFQRQRRAAHRRDDRKRHPVPQFGSRRRRGDLTGTAARGDRVAHLVGAPQRHDDRPRRSGRPPRVPIDACGARRVVSTGLGRRLRAAYRMRNSSISIGKARSAKRQRDRPVVDRYPQRAQRSAQFRHGGRDLGDIGGPRHHAAEREQHDRQCGDPQELEQSTQSEVEPEEFDDGTAAGERGGDAAEKQQEPQPPRYRRQHTARDAGQPRRDEHERRDRADRHPARDRTSAARRSPPPQ